MPTDREREYYSMGFRDGQHSVMALSPLELPKSAQIPPTLGQIPVSYGPTKKGKRKLSAWNKYVKANSKKPRFRYRNGKLNLKKMAVSFRKTPAGKKKRR